MARPPWEVADIFRRYGAEYRQKHGSSMSNDQIRVMQAIEDCRTAALGGHVEACTACGECQIAYNSCRNRHCPKCQSLAKAKWLEARQSELLPVEYFHVVFTVPEEIAKICLQNKRTVYNILFKTTAATLRTIGADPKHLGALIGFLAVLHSWGQNLSFHPHLHCIVPGGGFDLEGKRWIACKPGFFLPVLVLSRRFRHLFLEAIDAAYRKGDLEFHGRLSDLRDPEQFKQYLEPARQSEWVVYAKPPFGGPEKVLDYLGRYTHRVAISNHRIVDVADTKVTFRWRDYRRGKRLRTMTLDSEEFTRRFLTHVLPSRFVRIRHFGFLANRQRTEKLEQARKLIGTDAKLPDTDRDQDCEDLCDQIINAIKLCPSCGEGRLVCIETLPSVPASDNDTEGIDSS